MALLRFGRKGPGEHSLLCLLHQGSLALVVRHLKDAVRSRCVELVGQGCLPVHPSSANRRTQKMIPVVAPRLLVTSAVRPRTHRFLFLLLVSRIAVRDIVVIFFSQEEVRPSAFPIRLEVLLVQRSVGWEQFTLLQVKLLYLCHIGRQPLFLAA